MWRFRVSEVGFAGIDSTVCRAWAHWGFVASGLRFWVTEFWCSWLVCFLESGSGSVDIGCPLQSLQGGLGGHSGLRAASTMHVYSFLVGEGPGRGSWD